MESTTNSSQSCLICGGTLKDAMGNPCPKCTSKENKTIPIVAGIPAQYQGVGFDKSFLPMELQGKYGEFMEELMITIINDIAFYQKNLVICSRPNSGKTVWTYNLYSELTAKGYKLPTLRDITEVRNILNSYENKEEAVLYSEARCAVIKLPRDMQPWMFDTMSYVIERRVRNNGFTIFLFGGTLEELKMLDKFGRLGYLRGTGAYNTVQIESFEKENRK